MMVRFVVYSSRPDEPLCTVDMAAVPRHREVVELPWIGDQSQMHRYNVHHVRWSPLDPDCSAVVTLVR